MNSVMNCLIPLLLTTATHQPNVTVTETAVTVWFPVADAPAGWSLGKAEWCLYHAGASLPLFGESHGFFFCYSGTEWEDVRGTLQRVVDGGSASFSWRDANASNGSSSCLVAKEVDRNGFSLTLRKPEWVRAIIGSQLDSMAVSLSFSSKDRWERSVAIDYQVSAAVIQQARIEYQAKEALARAERERVCAPRAVSRTLASFKMGNEIRLYDLDGTRVSNSGLLNEQALSVVSDPAVSSFAINGESVIYTNVSVFQYDMSTGSTDTLIAGAVAHYGVYYDDAVIDPTGRYLAVPYGNGTDDFLLYDFCHRRKLYSEMNDGHPVWAQDGSVVSLPGTTYPVQLPIKPLYHSERTAVLNGDVFYDYDGLVLRRLPPAPGTPTSHDLPPRRAYRRSQGQINRSWEADAAIIGFVGGEIILAVDSQILIFDVESLQLRRAIDAGPGFEESHKSIQHVFVTP